MSHYNYDFEVIKTTSGVPVFQHSSIGRIVLAFFLPAYFFEGGRFDLWREGTIVNACDHIKPLGPGNLVALNRLRDFTMAGRGSQNQKIRWSLYPWEFPVADRLVFSLEQELHLTREMVRLQLHLEEPDNRYMPGQCPPKEYYGGEFRRKIRTLEARKVIVLRLPSGNG